MTATYTSRPPEKSRDWPSTAEVGLALTLEARLYIFESFLRRLPALLKRCKRIVPTVQALDLTRATLPLDFVIANSRELYFPTLESTRSRHEQLCADLQRQREKVTSAMAIGIDVRDAFEAFHRATLDSLAGLFAPLLASLYLFTVSE